MIDPTPIKSIFYNELALSNFKNKMSSLYETKDKIMNLNVWGDSVSVGWNANIPEGFFSVWNNGYVNQMRQTLENIFQPVGRGLLIPFTNGGSFFAFSGEWTTGFSAYGASETNPYGIDDASYLTSESGAIAQLTFDGTGIVVLYQQTPDSGSVTVQVDNNNPVTVNCQNNDVSIGSKQIDELTDEVHTLKITKSDDGNKFYLLGAYELKGSYGVRVNNMSVAASSVDNVTPQALNLMSSQELWNADLTIIALIINGGHISEDMPHIIEIAKQTGDVLLVGGGTLTNMQSNISLLYDFADEYDVALCDLWTNQINPVFINDLNGYKVHMNSVGHYWQAQSILNMIIPDQIQNVSEGYLSPLIKTKLRV